MIERLPPRLLLSADRPDVDPALAQRLDAAGYEPVPWHGGQVYAEPGEWIVSLRGVRGTVDRQTALAERRLAALRRGLHVKQHLGADGMFLVGAPVSFSPSIVHTALGRVLGVRFAEPNFAVWPQSIEPQGSQIAPQGAPLPNDTYFHLQYGLHNTGFGVADADVDGPEAWEFMAGVSVGNPVVVGVIDTGIDYNHPDLVPSMWVNPLEVPGDGIDNDDNGYVDDVHGADFYNDDGDPMDGHNHGTHVAGIVAAARDDGRGVAGIAAGAAKLMALQIMSADGFGGVAQAVKAMNYVLEMKDRGVNVLITNNSWGWGGGRGDSEAFEQLISDSHDAGLLYVAAAGNGGDDRIGDDLDAEGNAFWPASFDIPGIISVAATSNNDVLGTFSNFGAAGVDLAAPGVAVYSTIPGGRYGYISGTSMASPLVAGAAALAFAYKPTATAQQVQDALMLGVDRLTSLSGKTVSGGRLSAYGTLQRLLPTEVADRHVFYNHSAFDGRDGAANAGDDGAVATDKQALLPGGIASFANYTSYSRGINGVMVDVRNLPAGNGLAADDFEFSVGGGLLEGWSAAPVPASVSVRRGAGVDGADRVTITFADGAVKNTWLRARMLPTPDTGLASADVFYFGNAIGETGNSVIDTLVNGADVTAVRSNLFTTAFPIAGAYDIDRDGRVSATDLLLVRTGQSALPLPLITPPV